MFEKMFSNGPGPVPTERAGRSGRAGWVGMGLGDPHEKLTFSENVFFRPILNRFVTSRPQKWIRLEILHRIVVLRGLET